MPTISVYGKELESIFELLGTKEDNISYSVGWALSNSPTFLKEFLKLCVSEEILSEYSDEVENTIIRLQQYEKKKGFTDFEIELPGRFFILIEAKRGWNLPSANQIDKYLKRSSFVSNEAPIKKLIVLSECEENYALNYQELPETQEVIGYLPWKAVYSSVTKAISRSTGHAEKRLLNDLETYLRKVITMQNVESNRVYVVVLSDQQIDGWTITFRQVVEDHQQYFHPVGNSYPKEPVNYIAFRYNGRLQSIHHVDSYKVVTNQSQEFPDVCQDNREHEPHYLYQLGEAIVPRHEVKNGKIYPTARLWCMLDTLLTCSTISEARDVSQSRLNAMTK